MITENDLFNIQKAIVYSFRNIPDYVSTFLEYLHDVLCQVGSIKTLNYDDNEMAITLDIITECQRVQIYGIIYDCYTTTITNCIDKGYLNNNTSFLADVPEDVIKAVLPICCTILDITTANKDSLVFRVNLHN